MNNHTFSKDKKLFLRRLIISDVSFLTASEKLLLEKSCHEDISSLSLSEISVVVKRALGKCSWNGKKVFERALASFSFIEKLGIRAVHYEDTDFPPMLREMKDPPYMIFYRGNLEVLKQKCVSVVGTRRASASGVKAAAEFARDACDDGCCVVSGLAFGIDAAAHKGALLSEKAATCAVLPSGIDIIVPFSHKNLAARIIERDGLILSEFTPGTPALPFRFVQRNRIVAALSSATLVVQAPGGSGAMITAGLALDYNRDVLFHKAAFSEDSRRLEAISEQRIKNLVAQGKKVEYKLNNCPRNFVDDGAPIIKNYAEFKQVLAQESIYKKITSENLLPFCGENNG